VLADAAPNNRGAGAAALRDVNGPELSPRAGFSVAMPGSSTDVLRRLAPGLAGLALCACHGSGVPMAKASPELDQPAPAAAAAAAKVPAYVGRWAVTPSACAARAWNVGADQLRSPGPFSCSFTEVTPTLAGYTVLGMCRVGKASAPGRLVFTMTQLPSGPSLTVSGGPFQEPIGLVRCGEPVQAAAGPGRRRG